MPASPRSRPLWAWLETVVVPGAATRARVDVLHSPANFGPIGGGFAHVVTLHDMLFRRHPDLLTLPMRAGTELLLPPAARRAHGLITVSKASRDDIVRLLGISPDRVDVIPNGWSAPRTTGRGARARELLGLDERPVALSVASDLPHKNLRVLLDGLALVPAGERPQLVLAGHGTDSGALPPRAQELGVERDTRLLGSVAEPMLEDLYAAAAMVIAPTRAEGFGLPVLEALGRGVVVACSDLPVLREVAGDFALWFQPGDAHSVAEALRRAAHEDAELERLRKAGREHAQQFSWQSAAEKTWETYERAHRRR
jgi:glycosyltransferase involved in cell wall biosynthesis